MCVELFNRHLSAIQCINKIGFMQSFLCISTNHIPLLSCPIHLKCIAHHSVSLFVANRRYQVTSNNRCHPIHHNVHKGLSVLITYNFLSTSGHDRGFPERLCQTFGKMLPTILYEGIMAKDMNK